MGLQENYYYYYYYYYDYGQGEPAADRLFSYIDTIIENSFTQGLFTTHICFESILSN
jgi:hypothetical protein